MPRIARLSIKSSSNPFHSLHLLYCIPQRSLVGGHSVGLYVEGIQEFRACAIQVFSRLWISSEGVTLKLNSLKILL